MYASHRIDFAKIDFPSDELTLKTIRRLHPGQIDAGAGADITVFTDGDMVSKSAGAMLTDLLDGERTLAEAAFNRVLGHR